jgi:hypothetical protein
MMSGYEIANMSTHFARQVFNNPVYLEQTDLSYKI